MFVYCTYRIDGIKNALDWPDPNKDYVDLHTTMEDTKAYNKGYRVTVSVGRPEGYEITRHLTVEQAEELGTALLYLAKLGEQNG
jgi:hypothetical protein